MIDDAPLTVSGTLTPKEIQKTLARRRSDTIGPTTVYYAGATAPIISAGMALVSHRAFDLAGLAEPWAQLVASIVAAMAGITWYLIFMRWSWKRRYGRAGEVETELSITLDGGGLSIARPGVATQIDHAAILGAKREGDYLVIEIDRFDTIVVPVSWFPNEAAATAFAVRLTQAGTEEAV